MNDPVEWAKSVAATVKDYCGRAIEPVLARLTALEQRQPEKGDPGRSVTVEEVTPIIEKAVADEVSKITRPKDGKSVTIDEVIPLIQPPLEIKAAEVARQAVAELPRPKDVTLDELRPVIQDLVDKIPRPKDGKSVTVEEASQLIDGAVSAAVARIPIPKALTLDDIRPLVADAVAAVPPPKDGKSVTTEEMAVILTPMLEAKASEVARQAVGSLPPPKDGKSVTPEEVLPALKAWFDALPKPKDGLSVTVNDVLPHFHQAFDRWALDFERRAQDVHMRLLSTFDKPKDGADGLGFDDMEEEFDGERTVIRRYRRGDQVKEFRHKFHCVLERGVYKADRTYERGDAVTADGSYWIAQKDAPSGKPGQSPDWRLAVKKGRDGKGS